MYRSLEPRVPQRDGDVAVPAVRELRGAGAGRGGGGWGGGAGAARAEAGGAPDAGAVLPVRAQSALPRARVARQPALPLQGNHSTTSRLHYNALQNTCHGKTKIILKTI